MPKYPCSRQRHALAAAAACLLPLGAHAATAPGTDLLSLPLE